VFSELAEQKQLPDFLVLPAGRIGDWSSQTTASGEKVPMTSEKIPQIPTLETRVSGR
jgi:hypothetical protein